MRKTIKRIATLIFILALAALGWIAWKWVNVNTISGDAFTLIPQDAVYRLATADPIKSWRKLADSKTWRHLQGNDYVASLTKSANDLDSLIRENDILFNLIGERELIVSAHTTAQKEYDFLFLVNLKKTAGIKFINEYLSEFSIKGYTVKKDKYLEDDILVLHNIKTSKDLYISQPGTYLLASFTRSLITKSLDTKQLELTNASETFIKTVGELGHDDLLQLYVNYTMLPQFMACYSDGKNEYVERLSKTLLSTRLNVNMEEDFLQASGYTYVNDSVESYLKTLLVSGKGPTEFAEIASQRTAFCMAFGFSSFREFFQNFEKNLQQDVKEYADYRNNLKQVEDYLKIDLQKNFIDWIGDEVALLEMQSYGAGSDNEVALVLKAENIEKARSDLDYVEKMIRKRTPVKFKAVDHRGYRINYLSMKGLFKVLLGKFFARYDKPYYTIINNFVVFSSHPQALKSMIDDYLDKNTLIKSEEFRNFRAKFNYDGSVFAYLNTPVLFNTMKKLADYKTKASMEKNKEYIVCFRQVGFQLVPDGTAFKTTMAEQFEGPEEPAPALAEVNTDTDQESSFSEEPNEELEEEVPVIEEEEDPMKLPYIYVQNLNASIYRGYYPDSSLHYKVELKNGFKNGAFTEYYETGEVKLTGHFRNDKQDGVWKLFDENGKLLMRRTYNEGEVKKER